MKKNKTVFLLMLGAVFPFLYYFNKNYDVTFQGKLQDIKPDSRFTKELSDDTRAANHVESNAKYDVIDSQMQDEHAEKPSIADVTKATTKPAISEYLLNRPRLWAELVASGNTLVKQKQLPRLIGIGVEKCGTHAFLHFIKPHPLIKVMHNIEAHFFDERSNQPISNYLAMMPEVGPNDFVMEKTPAYFSFPPYQIPRLIKTHVPQAKIVLILCEPAKRVYSDFVHEWAWHNISHNWSGIDKFATIQDYLKVYLPKMSSAFLPYNESTSSSSALQVLISQQKDYMTSILTTGFYALHLKRWLKYYDDKDMMVIDGNELFNSPGDVIERVQDFVGLPKVLFKQDYVRDPTTGFFCYKEWNNKDRLNCLPSEKQRTRSKSKNSFPDEVLQELKRFYNTHNEALFKLLGRRLWDS